MEPSRTHRGEHEHWPFDRQGDSREYHHWATSVYSRLKSAAPPTRKSSFTLPAPWRRRPTALWPRSGRPRGAAPSRTVLAVRPADVALERPNSTTCQSAGPATGGLPATSRRNPREGGKQGTPESGREAEEVIAVEVERTGGMMPSPRNPDRRPLQRNA